MSVVADFKEFEAPKRKKTTPLKSVKLKASVPNPSLASNIFTRSVTASTGAGGHKAPLSAVLIGTKSSGGVHGGKPAGKEKKDHLTSHICVKEKEKWKKK